MNWLQRLIERICLKSNLARDPEGKIRIQNYVISVVDDDNLFSIRVVDLVSGTPPKVTGPMYHDEVEDNLVTTIRSL